MKLASLAALAGAVVAIVLGFVTVGVQATADPHGLPVAVAAPPALRPAAEHVTTQGGGILAWRVATPDEARKLLEDKKVYGILQLGQPNRVIVSGAINPAGTQIVQQILTTAAAPAQVETVHPASAAGRAAPLAVSILAWLGSLAAGAVLLALTRRRGDRIGLGARLTRVLLSAVLMTAVLAGFLRLWDASLPRTWPVYGFIFLVSVAFAAIQGALFRLLGFAAMAILAPLYLLAPAVAGQVPELLNPVYKAALWSWTPFRFSTEGMRSILQGTSGAPDVRMALWVLGVMLAVGLVVLLWPGRRRVQEAPTVVRPMAEVSLRES